MSGASLDKGFQFPEEMNEGTEGRVSPKELKVLITGVSSAQKSLRRRRAQQQENGFVGSSVQTTMEAKNPIGQAGQKFQLQVQECASTVPSG